MGCLDKTGKMSVSADGQRFRDCKTGRLYEMKRIDGAMVILETSDGEDDRREIGLLSSLISAWHYSPAL